MNSQCALAFIQMARFIGGDRYSNLLTSTQLFKETHRAQDGLWSLFRVSRRVFKHRVNCGHGRQHVGLTFKRFACRVSWRSIGHIFYLGYMNHFMEHDKLEGNNLIGWSHIPCESCNEIAAYEHVAIRPRSDIFPLYLLKG
ncbi:hypothetical protein AN403_5480 [Pseudomonas fluorescens]|uniref:Uncharacterized protein n=1 Tax=Pseudomonas fluorescens TaxID=294 RepID=A0A0P8X5V8_PSEFL|nr:hypothetical protein AN403_5480 [Pseudomonas fluorescens]